MSLFLTRAAVPTRTGLRYAKSFPRLRWQLFVRRLESALTKRSMDRLVADWKNRLA